MIWTRFCGLSVSKSPLEARNEYKIPVAAGITVTRLFRGPGPEKVAPAGQFSEVLVRVGSTYGEGRFRLDDLGGFA